VRAAVSDLGKPIQKMQVALGETAYEILERVARWAGYLIYEDSAGMLVIDRVGTKRMASGFSMPGIIEAAQITAEIAGRYSDYLVVWNAISQLTELSNTANQRGSAHDPTMPRKRLRVIVSPQLDPTAGASDIDFGQQLANWEMARRIGRSQAMAVTCDTWRDTAGRLWTPNFLAPINVPQGKLANKEWIIGTVTYRKDASGTHADVILMPPDAFRPQPGVLYLFDRESTADPPTSQDPAPPGTPGAQGHA
jgi:prophage tail gpP-like protein